MSVTDEDLVARLNERVSHRRGIRVRAGGVLDETLEGRPPGDRVSSCSRSGPSETARSPRRCSRISAGARASRGLTAGGRCRRRIARPAGSSRSSCSSTPLCSTMTSRSARHPGEDSDRAFMLLLGAVMAASGAVVMLAGVVAGRARPPTPAVGPRGRCGRRGRCWPRCSLSPGRAWSTACTDDAPPASAGPAGTAHRDRTGGDAPGAAAVAHHPPDNQGGHRHATDRPAGPRRLQHRGDRRRTPAWSSPRSSRSSARSCASSRRSRRSFSPPPARSCPKRRSSPRSACSPAGFFGAMAVAWAEAGGIALPGLAALGRAVRGRRTTAGPLRAMR